MRVVLHTKVHPDRVAEPERLPVDIGRQARMAELLDVVHDCSEAGTDAGLPVVWELP
jgi:L-rhamnose mutarotase